MPQYSGESPTKRYYL